MAEMALDRRGLGTMEPQKTAALLNFAGTLFLIVIGGICAYVLVRRETLQALRNELAHVKSELMRVEGNYNEVVRLNLKLQGELVEKDRAIAVLTTQVEVLKTQVAEVLRGGNIG